MGHIKLEIPVKGIHQALRHVSPSAGLCGLFTLEDDKRNAQGFQRLCERMSAGCTER